MGDAARHLAERAQALLLHDLLLGGAQIVVSLLQGAVELDLVGCERGVLAHLAQEFALAAAERLGAAPGRDQHTEHLALDHQRREHERTQAGAREALRKGELGPGDVGFVDEVAVHAARQAIGVDGDLGFLEQSERLRHGHALGAHAVHREQIFRHVVEEHAAEVDR
jgi:hypothetical protein